MFQVLKTALFYRFLVFMRVKAKNILFTTSGQTITEGTKAIQIRHHIGAAENTDDFTLIYHWKSPEIIFYHQMGRLTRTFFRMDCDYTGAHERLDW